MRNERDDKLQVNPRSGAASRSKAGGSGHLPLFPLFDGVASLNLRFHKFLTLLLQPCLCFLGEPGPGRLRVRELGGEAGGLRGSSNGLVSPTSGPIIAPAQMEIEDPLLPITALISRTGPGASQASPSPP